MIPSHFRRSFAYLGLLFVTALLVGSQSRSAASEPKVNLEEAKAELAKAKSEETDETTAPVTEAVEESPSRKRLFSFGKKRGKEAPTETPTEEVPTAAPAAEDDSSEEAEAKKPRFRLFTKKKTESSAVAADEAPEPQSTEPEATSDAEPETTTKADPEQPSPEVGQERPKRFRLFASKSKKTDVSAGESTDDVSLVEQVAADQVVEETGEKRAKFSLFRKRETPSEPEADPESETTNPTPSPDEGAELAELKSKSESPPSEEQPAQSADPEPTRKPLFGGLFAKKTDTPSDELSTGSDVIEAAEEPTPDESDPVSAPSEINQKPAGSSLFGFLRRDPSKGHAEAEKTKLGNSLESDPDLENGELVAKKKSKGGELGWYVITDAKTPFYAIGPGQPLPPEKILDRGSMLTVTKGGWGWCNVKLGNGALGVVATKSMRPATVAEVSRKSQGGATASRSSGSRRLFNILSRGPAPKPELPSSSSSEPIRNFGLLPPIDSND